MSDEPFFQVTSGSPTAEELAAMVGVLWARRQAAAAAAAAATPRVPTSKWRASAAPRAGRLPIPGPGAWASAR
jgi:hypothetical protein